MQLRRKRFRLLGGVIVSHSDEDDETRARNGTDDLAIDFDPGLRDALDDRSHA